MGNRGKEGGAGRGEGNNKFYEDMPVRRYRDGKAGEGGQRTKERSLQ